MNKQTIIGFVGKDPEPRVFPDGTKEAKFTVADGEKGYTTTSGTQVPDHTEWFNVVVKGSKADFALNNIKKGNRVYIEGKTFTNEKVDNQGIKKTYREVRCSELILLDKPQQTQAQPQAQPQPQAYNGNPFFEGMQQNFPIP